MNLPGEEGGRKEEEEAGKGVAFPGLALHGRLPKAGKPLPCG